MSGADDAQPPTFAPGDIVILDGLASSSGAKLNGQRGRVLDASSSADAAAAIQRGRVPVRVHAPDQSSSTVQTVVCVKPENLRLVTCAHTAAAAESPLTALPDALLELVVQKLGAIDAQRARPTCRRLRDLVDRAEWSRITVEARRGTHLCNATMLVERGRIRLRPRSELHLIIIYEHRDESSCSPRGSEYDEDDSETSADMYSDAHETAFDDFFEFEVTNVFRACAATCTSVILDMRATEAYLRPQQLILQTTCYVGALLDALSPPRATGQPRVPSPLESLELRLERARPPGEAGRMDAAELQAYAVRAASDLVVDLARAPRFRRLALPDWCLLHADAAAKLARAHPRLQSLDAAFPREKDLRRLAPLAALEELSVRFPRPAPLAEGFVALAAGPAARSLRRLRLGSGGGRRALRVALSGPALGSLARLAALEELDFLLEVEGHGAGPLEEALAGAPRLRRLAAALALGPGRPAAPARGLAAALRRSPSIRHLELSLWVDGVLGEEEGAALAALAEAAAPSLRRAELLVGGRAGEEEAAAEAARGALRRGGALGARLAESLRPPAGPWTGAWAA